MQTKIKQHFLKTEPGKLANTILRSCVHCGFCNATCPTYQILGNELDSPRGRIYLIKLLLEGQSVSKKTLTHLDRCLTCRACETTCPSGVKYGQLLEIGRHEIEKQVKRTLYQRFIRKALLLTLPFPQRFNFLLKQGQRFRPILPTFLKKSIPESVSLKKLTLNKHKRKMLILEGCVQPALSPEINHATRKVLDVINIELISFPGCCGAIHQHLSDEKNARITIKNNIDRLISEFDNGIEGIIMTASGCGAMFKDYPHLLRDDEDYKNKAEIIASKTFDLTEIINAEELKSRLNVKNIRVAVQTPCTLQHAQRLPFNIENILLTCGYQLTNIKDKHLCCGSAGTYSITQNKLAHRLREQRLKGLMVEQPDIIVTANIGCLHHLNEASTVPVKHWIEIVAEDLKY